MTYNIFKQQPVFPPAFLEQTTSFDPDDMLIKWITCRALELFYTSWDLSSFAKDCRYDGPPFHWDEDRRFELRCELDAAFFHLYLPSNASGDWVQAENETAEQLAGLERHFPTPRAAVSHILDQFPIVREKDERRYGRFRTKERILSAYDDMKKAMKGS